MIGHDGHPEVEGTMGQAEEGMHLVETRRRCREPAGRAIRTSWPMCRRPRCRSTTRPTSSRRSKARFPNIIEPKKGDICYATTNRQEAVKFMAPQVEVVIVVGSPNSSNSNRLREVADKMGTPAYMVDNAAAHRSGLAGRQAAHRRHRRRVGARGAGASRDRPPQGTGRGAACAPLEGVEENVTFPLPKGLDGVRQVAFKPEG